MVVESHVRNKLNSCAAVARFVVGRRADVSRNKFNSCLIICIYNSVRKVNITLHSCLMVSNSGGSIRRIPLASFLQKILDPDQL